MTVPGPPRRGRRSRSGAVLGGVCAGIARSAGLDPLLLRVAVVAVTVLTGGAGLAAYLAAWVLIPREDDVRHDTGLPTEPPPHAVDRPSAAAVGDPAGPDVRAAWTTVGHDLRSLADRLRRPPAGAAPGTTGAGAAGTAGPAGTPGTGRPARASAEPGPADGPVAAVPDTTDLPPGVVPPPRSPLTAADDAATALGERLRTPEVQAGARRAATSVSQALSASVDEVGRRVRRERPR